MTFRESLVNLLKTQCLQSPQFGAEVGVHRGRTSKLLLTEFPRMHLYLVDSWTIAPNQTADRLTHLTQEEQEAFYLETLAQVQFFGDRAEVLRMDSVAAIEFMQPLDCAFIDADHGYEGCKMDIRAYWEGVRPRGVVCGHDYHKDDLPGVTQAVDEFASEIGISINEADGNIWWARKP